MKLKKILPVFLASLSCSPFISASENKPNSASSTKLAITALAGAGVGAVIAGLSVRSVKNNEVEEEKEKVKTLQSENDSLKQENNNLKEQIKKINTLVGLAEDANHDVLINKLKSFSSNDLSKAKSMWDKIKSTTPKYSSNGMDVSIFDDLKYFDTFKENFGSDKIHVCFNTFRSFASLLEFLFEDDKDESVKVTANYDQTDAKTATDENSKLQPKMLAVH